MIALWGALKSCIRPGERVLAVSTGVFGYGIGEMAAAIGALAWASLAALHQACSIVLDEGLDNVYARHGQAARLCRDRARDIGLSVPCR